MEQKVEFQNFESKNYQRTYAGIVYISHTPNEEVGLDFFEEYVDSVRMMDRDDKEEENETIFVKREKKVSVIMTKDDAIYMAQRILEKFNDEENLEVEEDLI